MPDRPDRPRYIRRREILRTRRREALCAYLQTRIIEAESVFALDRCLAVALMPTVLRDHEIGLLERPGAGPPGVWDVGRALTLLGVPQIGGVHLRDLRKPRIDLPRNAWHMLSLLVATGRPIPERYARLIPWGGSEAAHMPTPWAIPVYEPGTSPEAPEHASEDQGGTEAPSLDHRSQDPCIELPPELEPWF